MYYAVAFKYYNREFMIGKNNYFYSNDKYMIMAKKLIISFSIDPIDSRSGLTDITKNKKRID